MSGSSENVPAGPAAPSTTGAGAGIRWRRPLSVSRRAAGAPGTGPRPDIVTRWGLVPARELSALIAKIRERSDVVVGAITSIADPGKRWEALQRGDAAVEAVLAATPPEEKRMLEAVALTSRSARFHSAGDLVAAFAEAHGPDGDRAASPFAGGRPPDPEGGRDARGRSTGRPAGETAAGGGAGGVDEEEARLAAEMAMRRRQAILSRPGSSAVAVGVNT